MKLELESGERLLALTIFNNPANKVSTSDLKIYLEDVAKIRITEDEKKDIDWVETKKEDGTMNITYSPNKLGVIEVEFSEFTTKYLKDKLTALEVSAHDFFASSVVSLMEKL